MKTNWQDPQTSEIRSTHISGLQDAIGKIEDVLDLKLQAETAVPLTEVYISEQDRYRIYQAPAGKRNWASSPSPVIKKNGVVISSGFTIDYGGGAIIVSPAATSTDTFTADVSYTKTADNALDAHKADITSDGIANKIVRRDEDGRIIAKSNTLDKVGQALVVYDSFESGYSVGAVATSNLSINNGAFLLIVKNVLGANAEEVYLYGIAQRGNQPARITIFRDTSTDVEVTYDSVEGKVKVESTTTQPRTIKCRLVQV